jgi:hypothetical protein
VTARAALVGIGIAVVATTGCGAGQRGEPVPGGAASPTPMATATAPSGTAPSGAASAAVTKYERTVDAARQRGLEVWLEADLVKRWHAGRDVFDAGIAQLAVLAARPGVVGVKVADELGYNDGFDRDPDGMLSFLQATRAAFATTMPGTKILIDMVVPDLGCVATGSDRCASKADRRRPALALDRLDRIFADRLVDVVDISTGLLGEATYRRAGTTQLEAQQQAWQEIARRGWGATTVLQSRKAVAHPDRFTGGADGAEAMLRLFVDAPLAGGAVAVDLWTWRQTYQGEVVRLLDPGLRDNPLWDGIRERHQGGARLFTHITPSSLETGLDADLDVLARGFGAVFVAAGIG